MTTTKLKRAARARQVATGERYTEALARVQEEFAMSEETELAQLREENRQLRAQLSEFEGTAAPDPWALATKRGIEKTDSPVSMVVYSTARMESGLGIGRTRLSLFTVPVGASGQGFKVPLTRCDTNLMTGGQIPCGLSVDVTLVSVELFGNAEDVAEVRRHGALAWDFLATEVDLGPLNLIVPAGASTGALKIGTESSRDQSDDGLNLFRVHGDRGVRIPGTKMFCVKLLVGSTGYRLKEQLDIRVTLGVRPVQVIDIR